MASTAAFSIGCRDRSGGLRVWGPAGARDRPASAGLKIGGLALAASLLGGAAPPASSNRPPLIPVEALASLPYVRDPELSPSGHAAAARVTIGGEEKLAIFNTRDPAQRPEMVAFGKAALRWFSWASDERLLLGLSLTSKGMGVELPITRLFSFDVASKASRRLGTGRGMIADNVIFTDPAGRFVLLASQPDLFSSPSVERIDLATGATEPVQRPMAGVWNWFADGSGIVRAGVEYGDRRYKIYYRESAGAPLRLIESRLHVRDGSVIDAMRFVVGGQGVVITNGPTGRFAVYNYDFAANLVGAPIFEHSEVDVTDVLTPSASGAVDAVAYEDDRPRLKWFDPAMAKLQARIDRALPGKNNRVVSRSRDNGKVMVWSAAADDPGAYYLLDAATKRLNLFATPRTSLEGSRFAPVTAVRYAARDGLSIPAYLTLPVGREAKGLPLIVLPHGGPHARDSWTFDAEVQLLANRGYAVLQPQFRGSTGYGKDYLVRGFGQWGRAMQDDLDDGMDWLVGRGIVDAKRVCIMGTSYGGYAAMWGAIRNPERYRCAISMAGVSDVRAMLRWDAKQMGGGRYFKDWKDRVRGEEEIDLAAVSPLQQAARLRVPMLIAHGAKDTSVPPLQSARMVKAAAGNPGGTQSIVYPEAAHGFSRSEDATDFMRRVEAFLAKHNPS